MNKIIFLFLLLFASATLHAQSWTLKKESDGIKIYTANTQGSKIKAIKVEYQVEGTLSQLAALLLDVKAQDEWVYSTKSSTVLKKISDNELIYYSEKSMPSPFSNRDVVMHVKVTQQPGTHVMTLVSSSDPGYIPEKKGIVRVPHSKVTWTVTPAGKLLKIVYLAEADAGGSVPAWVVNMFITKGPYETFKKLKGMMDRPAYKNAKPDFIKNS